LRKILLFTLLLSISNSKCIYDIVEKLKSSYPQIKGCKDNYLIFQDGTKILFDDEKQKSFNELLNNPDIEDMFKFKYPLNKIIPSKNFDPGRIRNDLFFKKIYGKSANEVRKNLRYINWFGKKILVTKVNNIDKKLQAIEKELKKLPKGYRKFLTPIGGTFKWRYIAGTKRLSVHSFGAAIDINVKYSHYWKWSKDLKYKNKIPYKIVEIFEKYGFIWGGKWYHYDTMHFEYRPELLK